MVSPQVDKSFGTPFSGYSLSADVVIDRIIFGTIRRQGGYNFVERCFKEEYIEMKKLFVRVPLVPFKSTADTINLGENIKISQLSDEEINLLIQIGLCASLPYGTARVPQNAIRYQYSLPKVIGDRSFTPAEK